MYNDAEVIKMSDEVAFISYFMDKFNISSDEVADFLFVEKRTLYNYKNLNFDKLPNKAKEKFILFFQSYKEFYKENLSLEDIYEDLTNIDDSLLEYLRVKFLEISQIRKANLVRSNTEELLLKNDIKRDVNSLDKFLTDFRMLIEYSDLTKGYLYTIFEIIINKVDNMNDYTFLDYINKYEKKKKL
jgi:hypothetical protein